MSTFLEQYQPAKKPKTSRRSPSPPKGKKPKSKSAKPKRKGSAKLVRTQQFQAPGLIMAKCLQGLSVERSYITIDDEFKEELKNQPEQTKRPPPRSQTPKPHAPEVTPPTQAVSYIELQRRKAEAASALTKANARKKRKPLSMSLVLENKFADSLGDSQKLREIRQAHFKYSLTKESL